MLRASAAQQGIEINLKGVVDRSVALGVEHADVLLDFADAVTGDDVNKLALARDSIVSKFDDSVLAEAAAIAGNYMMNDVAANSIGIPLESMFVSDSEQYRDELGLNDYPSARNTLG